MVNEALNGKIDLQMNASTNGIDTVIWAQLTRCRYTVGSLRISIDKGTATDGGDLAVTMGLQYFEVQEVQTRPLIIRANLMASVNDSPPSSVNFDFRVTPDPVGASLRVRVSDGYVVAETDRQQLFSISAKNGTFDCNPGDGTCDSASGSVVPLFR